MGIDMSNPAMPSAPDADRRTATHSRAHLGGAARGSLKTQRACACKGIHTLHSILTSGTPPDQTQIRLPVALRIGDTT